ncbi:hypothetical protein BDQ17DRAFT_1441329 [Cyathus striatus]|nr:hypothetical protein BDQ17DRAFT_1441329 [Cyathus striatus]
MDMAVPSTMEETPIGVDGDATGIARNNDEHAISTTLSSVTSLTMTTAEEEDNNPNQWQTVTSRKSRSHDSHKGPEIDLKQVAKKARQLSTTQRKTVRQAEQALTPEEKSHISKWNKVIKDTDKPTSDEEEEQPPKDKGKCMDPKNWGNANLEPDEIDPDTQHVILEDA